MDFKVKFFELLSLPKEVALNLPVITLTGRDALDIENYKGLLEYTDTTVRVNTKTGLLVIKGKKLILKQITSENLLLSGDIERVYYGT